MPVLLALLLVLVAAAPAGAAASPAPARRSADPRACAGAAGATLRCAARRAGVRVGVGTEAGRPADDALAARQFDAVTLERSLVWSVVHPAAGSWDFSGADRSIAWARAHRLKVTATHFLWDQIAYATTPAWVKAIVDPARLRGVMEDHLATITRRYGRAIARWIVVNEPFRYVGDTATLQPTHFSKVLGPGWIAEAFRIARRAAPHAELWLNEVFTEQDGAKANALVALVRSLRRRGVPVDGVGLQGHLFSPLLTPIPADVPLVRDTMRRLAALGVDVAFTEVDAPLAPGGGRAAEQARRMSDLVRICLGVRRCRSLTFWNLHDGRSWIDDLFRRPDLAPTLFDRRLRPKPAFFAVRGAFRRGRPRR